MAKVAAAPAPTTPLPFWNALPFCPKWPHRQQIANSPLAGDWCFLCHVRCQHCHGAIPAPAVMAYSQSWRCLMAPCVILARAVRAYHLWYRPLDWASSEVNRTHVLLVKIMSVGPEEKRLMVSFHLIPISIYESCWVVLLAGTEVKKLPFENAIWKTLFFLKM